MSHTVGCRKLLRHWLVIIAVMVCSLAASRMSHRRDISKNSRSAEVRTKKQRLNKEGAIGLVAAARPIPNVSLRAHPCSLIRHLFCFSVGADNLVSANCVLGG